MSAAISRDSSLDSLAHLNFKFSFVPKLSVTYWSSFGSEHSSSRPSTKSTMGSKIAGTWVYLSIKINALGTSRSPR